MPIPPSWSRSTGAPTSEARCPTIRGSVSGAPGRSRTTWWRAGSPPTASSRWATERDCWPAAPWARRARPGDVRSNDHVVELPERVAGGERLLGEDVERGAAKAIRPQRLEEGGLVHDGATRDIDEPRGRLHGGELGGADQAPRRLRQGHREDDEVGRGQGRLEIAHPVDSLGLGHLPAALGHAEHAHAEGPRRARHGPADVSEADHAERRPEKTQRIRLAPSPLALLGAEELGALGEPQAPAEDVLGHPGPEDAGHARGAAPLRHPGQKKALAPRPLFRHPPGALAPGENLSRKFPGVGILGL